MCEGIQHRDTRECHRVSPCVLCLSCPYPCPFRLDVNTLVEEGLHNIQPALLAGHEEQRNLSLCIGGNG